jgi:hypothetical protein
VWSAPRPDARSTPFACHRRPAGRAAPRQGVSYRGRTTKEMVELRSVFPKGAWPLQFGDKRASALRRAPGASSFGIRAGERRVEPQGLEPHPLPCGTHGNSSTFVAMSGNAISSVKALSLSLITDDPFRTAPYSILSASWSTGVSSKRRATS